MYELIVIGAGPAGLAAACSAWEKGLRKILIIERDNIPGGILNQCIHNGFGLHRFKEELTGPEYANRFIEKLKNTKVELMLNTMALKITNDLFVHIINETEGYKILQTKSIILAMGCRERTRGAIGIPGYRPSGVLTAGAAQRYVNIEGCLPGKKIVILGSGDIGLIMARRLTLEGANVICCVEVMPYSGGLQRNIVQCLNDFNIPLYLSHTITKIYGKNRVEGVSISKVDEKRNPIDGTQMFIECDTVLLSVGLIPENELAKQAGIHIDPRTNGAILYENMQTSIPGIFACGNVAHVHDLVDNVSEESERAGAAAAEYVLEESKNDFNTISIFCSDGISYTVPQYVRIENIKKNINIFFRVNKIFGECKISVCCEGEKIASYKRTTLLPGQMQHISFPINMIRFPCDSITLSITEDIIHE